MAEAGRPVAGQAARAERQNPRAEVAGSAGEDQEPGVVGDKVQPVILDAEVPADPPVARPALQRRRREDGERQPVAAMVGDGAHGLADPRQCTEVVVRLHQVPEPGLVFRRDNVDAHLRKNHHRSPAPAARLAAFPSELGEEDQPK